VIRVSQDLDLSDYGDIGNTRMRPGEDERRYPDLTEPIAKSCGCSVMPPSVSLSNNLA
jgi:hypothetical protein